ncbi:hypothetical protein EVAR_9184_1 [Eumeta japonica]|uniref:Uncharacterized protein n=1 Tax=Eumeta variegata TaxID=151549 RepID=A0A4C1WP30_EUMVA|nr:hypothetical protein EVAR_9184_1 [Eumeta japonica]
MSSIASANMDTNRPSIESLPITNTSRQMLHKEMFHVKFTFVRIHVYGKGGSSFSELDPESGRGRSSDNLTLRRDSGAAVATRKQNVAIQRLHLHATQVWIYPEGMAMALLDSPFERLQR